MEQAIRPMLTVAEVARQVNVPEDTVRRWLRSGRLRGARPGGTKTGWRISENELARFIAAATSVTEPPG